MFIYVCICFHTFLNRLVDCRKADHLGDARVFLQLVESGFVPADEVFERAVVLDAEFPPGELHAALQLLHVAQDVLQTHCASARAASC